MNPIRVNTDLDIKVLLTMLTLVVAASTSLAYSTYQLQATAGLLKEIQQDIDSLDSRVSYLEVQEAYHRGQEDASGDS